MVDFKCDGYQNVIRAQGDTEQTTISKRLKNIEKETTSPYPFLDVASDLVAQMAMASQLLTRMTNTTSLWWPS